MRKITYPLVGGNARLFRKNAIVFCVGTREFPSRCGVANFSGPEEPLFGPLWSRPRAAIPTKGGMVPTHHFRADHRRTPQNSFQSGLMGIDRRAVRSSRDRATSCWRRIASVRTNNPPMESASLSSTKARARNCSTTAGVSLLKLPPPNSLISARCSSLDNASQPAASDILGAP
jgi:hypothetical protein